MNSVWHAHFRDTQRWSIEVLWHQWRRLSQITQCLIGPGGYDGRGTLFLWDGRPQIENAERCRWNRWQDKAQQSTKPKCVEPADWQPFARRLLNDPDERDQNHRRERRLPRPRKERIQ